MGDITEEMDKYFKNVEDDNDNEEEKSNDFPKAELEKIDKELYNTRRDVLNKLKIKHHSIRVHEDFDKFFDTIHKTLLLTAIKDKNYKKYKGIKKLELFSEIFEYAKSLNTVYVQWLEEYTRLTTSVLKYNYENEFPSITLLKGKHIVRSYDLYEKQINMLNNLSRKLHVYKLSVGDIILVTFAKFIKDKECLSGYNELSSLILNQWERCESDLPKKFYDINVKIAVDICTECHRLPLNEVMQYIDSVLDFTKDEIVKCKDKNYVYYMYSLLINDLYEKLKSAILKIYEKKQILIELYEGKFDVNMLEKLKNKIDEKE